MAENGRMRIHTIQFEADTGGATDQVITLTMALRENAVVETAVKKAYGETATIQEKVIKTIAEHKREARQLVAEIVRQENRTKALAREYEHLTSLTGKTADEQQVLNAVYRLGAGATQEQKTQITNLVTQHQQLQNASSNTQGSFRNLRGVSQNLGWQLQDVAVQAQMGTSAFVIFSQQGSQLASSFGPTGALVGAFIAVAGALAGVIFKSLDAKTKLKELEAAQKLVNEVFQEGVGDTGDLTEEYKKLYLVNKDLALLTARKVAITSKEEIRKSRDAVRELTREYFTLANAINAADLLPNQRQAVEMANANRIKQIEKQSKLLGITKEQYLELTELMAKNAPGAVSSKIAELAIGQGTSAKIALTDLAYKYEIESQNIAKSAERIADANRVASGELTPGKPKEDKKPRVKIDEITRLFNAQHKSLIKQTETTEEEYDRMKAIIDNYVKKVGKVTEEAAQDYIALEKWKTQENDKELDKRYKAEIKAIKKKEKEKEKALVAIYKAQVKQLKKDDPLSAETATFGKNMLELENQRNEAEMRRNYSEVARINALIEGEQRRNADVVNAISAERAQQNLADYSTIVGGMQNVFGQLAALAEEGSANAKALFYVNQGLAFANAIISANSAANLALSDVSLGTTMSRATMSNVIRGMGYANAAIIAGTTFAGAFDNGGVIPAGQAGLVAERYDEFVGGTMVYNKSGSGLNVTGSKDTANMMSGGSSSNVVNINQYITVSGNGDKALTLAMEQAAKKGAEDGAKKGYNMVKNDFNTGRGIRRDLKKSIGA